MIVLYSGIPGSGKSYKMVYDLIELKDKFYIVHNIDGMKKEALGDMSVNWLEYCDIEGMEVTAFFSKEYQLKFTEAVRTKYGRDCLVVIDEAHEWFDKNKRDLKMWLSYHRHLNQTIWLVAHRSTNLPAIYRSFIEVEYRAKSSSLIALPGFFIYQRIVGGEGVGYKFVRIKKEVFSYYKSQTSGYKKTAKSPILPLVLAFIVCGCLAFILIPKYFIFADDTKKEKYQGEMSVNSQQKQEVDENYVYIGRIGSEYLVHDVSSGQTVRFSQLKSLILIAASEIELIAYDQIKKKNIKISNLGVKRSTAITEPEKSGTNSSEKE